MKRAFSTAVCLGLLLLVVAACGGTDEATQQAAQNENWQALQQAHGELKAKRSELAELHAQLESQDESESADADAASEDSATTATAQDLQSQIAALEQEVQELASAFGAELVAFINANPKVEGVPPTDRQREAIRLKSHEDLLVAQQFIQESGDYRRAIEIYENALVIDPNNPELQQALEKAKSLRYMTAERFAQVEEGMSREEVEALLGPVYYRNVKEYPERGVVAWFYPRDPDSQAAAAVFFRQDEDGYYVYQADLDAVAEPGAAEPGAAEASEGG